MSRDEINRRSVLKQFGVVAAGGATLAAVGSESAKARQLEAQYHGREQLLEAFRTHGAGLPAALSEAGVVDETFDFGNLAFELDPEVTGMEPTDPDGLAGVTVTHTGGPTSALAMLSTSTDTHEISLFVQPQRENSYAIVESKADGDRLLVSDDGEATPASCTYWECSDDLCSISPDYYWEEQYICDTNCRNCEVNDRECRCSWSP